MIGKRMPRRRDGAPVARQVAQLAAYIDRRAPGTERGDILAQGQLHLIADTRPGQVAEMIATAMGAPRARGPVEHIVLSWRAGEQPALPQIEQALAILLEETGLRGHQVIWTLHLG
ncbi:relaxase/mobilization nuclease domain-containing protein, partial [Methylorubrum populi]|uniref:relaxase/mobilization nuclease domain-containing protein n=1 Tax=Methylorubrum populi TaxID=223967 RepID=UPI000DB40E86